MATKPPSSLIWFAWIFLGKWWKKEHTSCFEMCVSLNLVDLKAIRNLFGLHRPLCNVCMDRSTFPSSLQFVRYVHKLVSINIFTYQQSCSYASKSCIWHLWHLWHISSCTLYVRYARRTDRPRYELTWLSIMESRWRSLGHWMSTSLDEKSPEVVGVPLPQLLAAINWSPENDHHHVWDPTISLEIFGQNWAWFPYENSMIQSWGHFVR